jgi:hypothetical protein
VRGKPLRSRVRHALVTLRTRSGHAPSWRLVLAILCKVIANLVSGALGAPAQALAPHCQCSGSPACRACTSSPPTSRSRTPCCWASPHVMLQLGGMERTESEFRNLLTSAGFNLRNVLRMDAPQSVLVAVPE